MLLEKISGPVIGAMIGYCTNYIAVKMLFYPRKEIYIMGHKLPFTPGAIPKGKDRLAKAIGGVVSGTLLTEKDIKDRLLSDELENMVADKLMDILSKDLKSSISKLLSSEEEYESLKENLTGSLTDRVTNAVKNMNLPELITKEGGRMIKEKTDGTMLALFVSDELIASILQPVGGEFVRYIEKHRNELIKPEVESQFTSLENVSVTELLSKMEFTEEMLRDKMIQAYRSVAESAAGNVLKHINITGIVEDKISNMAVEDLEKLVLTVMKKELDVIVNLGAIIGALLGIFNMIF